MLNLIIAGIIGGLIGMVSALVVVGRFLEEQEYREYWKKQYED